VIEAGIAVAGLVAEPTPEGKYEVHPGGIQEVVADKGYHLNYARNDPPATAFAGAVWPLRDPAMRLIPACLTSC